MSITSSQTPEDMHDLVEVDSSGKLLIMNEGSTPSKIYYSINKCDDFGDNSPDYDDGDALYTGANNRVIEGVWRDLGNDRVYFVESDGGDVYASYIDLTDMSVNQIGNRIIQNATEAPDIFLRDGNLEVLTDVNDNFGLYIWADPNWNLVVASGLGAIEGLSHVLVKDANEVYFWVDTVGEVKMYCYTGAAINGLDDIANYSTINREYTALSYDGSDTIYFSAVSDPLDVYLLSYSIAGDEITALSEFSYQLMLDRNTASGVMEKAIHLSTDTIYQLHPVILHQLHHIATISTASSPLAITDNFLMLATGAMYEYEDVTRHISTCVIKRDDMTLPSGKFGIRNTVPIREGMFITIKDMFTTATVSASAIIFEGYVESYDDGNYQEATLISPAKELYEIYPNGEYSGRSDEIISSLITAYCKYVTGGTLSAGGAMGTIEFLGDKSMFQILNDLCIFDNFIWYLTPTGALYYNSGAVDTGENFTETSRIHQVKKMPIGRAINSVLITGGFVSGTQVTSDGSHTTDTDIQTKGINRYERNHSHLDTNALCNTTATNALSRYGTQPVMIEFEHFDSTVGLMQEGETITLEYAAFGLTISSDQWGIREVIYDAKRAKGIYTGSDRII